ncbi:MAG: hypothetical protein EOO09_20495 [Chitinophagaceae bacterium]|nr:MAG: hypothetical protein EOO09_20495 [Chitinophagaceae bacterium]
MKRSTLFTAFLLSCVIGHSQSTVTGSETSVDRKPTGVTTLSCGQGRQNETDNEKSNISSCGKGKVIRKGKQLVITTPGKTVTLANSGNEEDLVEYIFTGEIAAVNSYVVYKGEYEFGQYLLINKTTGAQTPVPDLDLYQSPDKKTLAVFSTDITVLMAPSEITLFSINGNTLTKVFKHTTFDDSNMTGWGTGSLKWLDNKTIEIEKVVVVDQATEEMKSDGKTWVTVTGGKWKLSKTKP